MSDDEAIYELSSLYQTSPTFLTAKEIEAAMIACLKIRRCSKYEKALLAIQSCESIQEINRIIVETFDMEEA